MSRKNPTGPIRRIACRIAAVVVLAGLPISAPRAQQPAAGAGGSAHAARPSEGKVSGDDDIPISLPTHRLRKQDSNIQASHFLKAMPTKSRPILSAAPSVGDRNAIGVPVLRHDAVPAAPLVGHVAVRAPAPQSGGGSSLGLRSGGIAPVRVPGAQPLVSSRGTLGGASFSRPGVALLPLGGPAKPGATGINGTSIRPKH